MGRKIPGRKHKGTRDPDKQRKERFNKLKNKINQPPSNPDFQEIPHSVNEIAKIKDKLNNARNERGIKNRKSKPSPLFTQKKGESNKQFLYRVHKACDTVIQENAFENKYGVDIKRNMLTGEVEGLVKKPKDEIDQLMKKMRKNKGGKRKQKSDRTVPALTKSQKRSKKILEKKQKKKLMKGDFETSIDRVKFGEVAHAPPVLNAPRKVVKDATAARPGQKQLLLKPLLQKQQSTTVPTKDKLNKVANKAIDKTGKRKNLPNAVRRKLDQQQTEIIKAYRLLKKQNYKDVDF